MFPSWADLHVAPFSDEQLYCEHYARAVFWSERHTLIQENLDFSLLSWGRLSVCLFF